MIRMQRLRKQSASSRPCAPRILNIAHAFRRVGTPGCFDDAGRRATRTNEIYNSQGRNSLFSHPEPAAAARRTMVGVVHRLCHDGQWRGFRPETQGLHGRYRRPAERYGIPSSRHQSDFHTAVPDRKARVGSQDADRRTDRFKRTAIRIDFTRIALSLLELLRPTSSGLRLASGEVKFPYASGSLRGPLLTHRPRRTGRKRSRHLRDSQLLRDCHQRGVHQKKCELPEHSPGQASTMIEIKPHRTEEYAPSFCSCSVTSQMTGIPWLPNSPLRKNHT